MNARTMIAGVALLAVASATSYQWGKRRGEESARSPSPPLQFDHEKPVDNSATLDDLRGKVVELSRSDYQDYLNLKDLRARYQKADELLGKLMLLVLTDLGIRLSPEIEQQVKSSAEGRAPELEETPQPLLTRQGKGDFGGSSGAEPTLEKSGKILNWERQEAQLEDLDSEGDVDDFLKKVTVKNLFDQLRAARSLNPSQVQALQGSFLGFVNFDDPNEKRWDVKLSFDGEVRGEAIKGQAHVELSKDGKRFSNSRSSGDLSKNFTSFAGGSRGIIVEANGGDGYFQLYAPPRLTSLVGVYYHKQGVGDFRRTGTVILVRQ